MSIDIRDITETVDDTEAAMANTATGAIVSVVDAATNPVRTVRRTVRRLEKRGEPVNRRIERRVNRTAQAAVGATADVVSGNLAERLTLAGIRLAKDRARKRDLVGDVLYRGVVMVHGGLVRYADEVGKFRTATEPPHRSGEGSPARRSPRPTATRKPAAARKRTSRARTARRKSA